MLQKQTPTHGDDLLQGSRHLKPMILIVDDDPLTLRLLRLMLEPAGYEVITAENGKEAVRQTLAHQPDVLLLDVMMPLMDGFAVCRELRANPKTAAASILILSTSAHIDAVQEGLHAGADKYLFKPIERNKLLREIKAALPNGRHA